MMTMTTGNRFKPTDRKLMFTEVNHITCFVVLLLTLFFAPNFTSYAHSETYDAEIDNLYPGGYTMGNHKLLRTDEELDMIEVLLNNILDKGAGKSHWWLSRKSTRDIWQTDDAIFNIDSEMSKLANFEYGSPGYNHEKYSLFPQWIFWLGTNVVSKNPEGTMFGKMLSSLRPHLAGVKSQRDMSVDEYRKLTSYLIDASALMPTNVSIGAVYDVVSQSPNVSRRSYLRYLVGLAYGLQMGKTESYAIQMGMAATNPRLMDSKEMHTKYWVGGSSSKYHNLNDPDYVPLEFVIDTSTFAARNDIFIADDNLFAL